MASGHVASGPGTPCARRPEVHARRTRPRARGAPPGQAYSSLHYTTYNPPSTISSPQMRCLVQAGLLALLARAPKAVHGPGRGTYCWPARLSACTRPPAPAPAQPARIGGKQVLRRSHARPCAGQGSRAAANAGCSCLLEALLRSHSWWGTHLLLTKALIAVVNQQEHLHGRRRARIDDGQDLKLGQPKRLRLLHPARCSGRGVMLRQARHATNLRAWPRSEHVATRSPRPVCWGHGLGHAWSYCRQSAFHAMQQGAGGTLRGVETCLQLCHELAQCGLLA